MHTENLCLLSTHNIASYNNSMHNNISIPPHVLLDTLILSTDFACIKGNSRKVIGLMVEMKLSLVKNVISIATYTFVSHLAI